MSYTIRWVDLAEAELFDAIEWYNGQRIGLGYDLAECVDAALNGLLRHPFVGTPVAESVRRILIRRFPYGIYYRAEGKVIEVVGFRHFKQKFIKISKR